MTGPVFDVCVVGAGPAGLGFAEAWVDAVPDSPLLVLEAGVEADQRFCTVHQFRGCRKASPCQVTGGIGGASGLAGGKLSEYPAGRGLAKIMGPDVESELEHARERLGRRLRLAAPDLNLGDYQGAREAYASQGYDLRHYDAYKYSQADLAGAWAAIASELRGTSATVLASARVVNIRERSGVFEILTDLHGARRTFEARQIVAASGRAGASYFETPLDGSGRRTIDVGVRLEYPSDLWPDMDKVHGDLKLHFDNARTFCASKSGWISPYRFRDFMLLEGRTDAASASPWSNIAITVRVDASVAELIEQVQSAVLSQGPGSSVRQPLEDFLAGKPTLKRNRTPSASFSYWRWGDIGALYTADVSEMLRNAVQRFSSDILPPRARDHTTVFGPELDYYWNTVAAPTSDPRIWAIGDLTGDYRGTLQAYAAGGFTARRALDKSDAKVWTDHVKANS